MKTFGKISAYFFASIILNISSYFLKSTFLSNFLCSNIITIIITLLAINTITSSFVISKLKEIEDEYKHNFNVAYEEIKTALNYQIVLVVLAVCSLIIRDGKYIQSLANNEFILLGIDVFLTMIFICSLDILRDTGSAMFEIIKPLNKDGKKEKK